MSKEQKLDNDSDSSKSTIETLEHMEREDFERIEEFRRRSDLLRGVIFGLLFGILGNMAVQHWYAIFESLTPVSLLLPLNVVIVIALLVALVYLTRTLYIQIKTSRFWEEHFRQSLEFIRTEKEKVKTSK